MFNSVRMRLTAWYAGVLALVLALFAVSTYLFLSRAIYRRTDETLSEISRAFADVVAREQANESDGETTENVGSLDAIREAADDLNFKNYRIFVFDAQKKLVASTGQTVDESNLPAKNLAELQVDFSNASPDSTFFTARENGKTYRAIARKLSLNGQNLEFFVVHSLEEEENLLAGFRNILLVGVPLALFPAIFGGYFLARKSLSPVVAMSATAANIGARNLHKERLPIKNARDELGVLARSFNDLLARLDDAFARQKRFMADASHELRTPIAIVRGESEVALLTKENRTAEDYRESLAVVQAESRRMTHLVEDLFTLARADAGQFPLVKTNFYLNELLDECIRAVKTLAEKAEIVLTLDAETEMPFHADEELVRRLFLNLLDNALKNTPPQGSIKIVAEKIGDVYSTSVADTGKGIAPEDKARVFERFYCADKARSRGEKDGAGLGLSIALWIAESHGGTLALEKSDANGSIFVVKFQIPDSRFQIPD